MSLKTPPVPAMVNARCSCEYCTFEVDVEEEDLQKRCVLDIAVLQHALQNGEEHRVVQRVVAG